MTEGEAGAGRTPAIPDAARDRYLLIAAALIGILGIAARIWVSHRTHALGEDALITLRYAENIAAGHGWVYNPGERVLGTTTPLYTILLALAAVLHLPAMNTGIAMNILADGATCFLIARLMARTEIGLPIGGLFAAVVYATSSTPISVSISGMETGLVTCAGLSAVYCFVVNRPIPLAVCGALLALLRIDGLALLGVLAIAMLVRGQLSWRAAAVFAAITLPWVIFAFVYFGSPVPASVIAKLTVYSHTTSTPGSFTQTGPFNREAFWNQFLLGWPQRAASLLFLIGSLTVARETWLAIRRRFPRYAEQSEMARRPDSRIDLMSAPLAWTIIYYGVMLRSQVPAFPWYFLPPWPVFVSVALIGACFLTGRAAAAIRLPVSRRDAIAIAGLALLSMAGIFHLRSIAADVAFAQNREDYLRRPLGLWLRDHLAPDERVLIEPIGYAGYFSGRRVLDMVGLVSPEVLPYYRYPGALNGIVNGLRPEWLCLRENERALLHAQDPNLPDTKYTLVRRFPSDSDPSFYLYHRSDRNNASAKP